MRKIVLAICATICATSVTAADVAYPNGFRDWRHVKSMILNKGHPLYDAVGGMHHIYANKTAMAGYKSGQYADGATLVFDLYEAVDKDNAISEGSHKAVVVMTRHAKAHTATDGWGYQVFDPKSRKALLDTKAQADCHACHVAQKDKGFVFSSPRD